MANLGSDRQVFDAVLRRSPPPQRTVVRRITAAMFDAGKPVYCVWTGQKLCQEALDIDHCLPFSAWPNADL
ncbi:hypothetical protein [Azospirillum sp.]|uniref:hypothetical protein n=1 Tax=Azospirillum sp. TaxID=34012 RepID=UPI003D703A36